MTSDPSTWLPLGNTLGVVSLLVIIVSAFVTGKIITRGEYDRLVAELQELRGQMAVVIENLLKKGN